MKDGPNGKRYGRRHEKTGHIIKAYGFDLSSIAIRHREFMRLAEEGRAERAAMGRLRRRLTNRQEGHHPADPRDGAGIQNALVRALRDVETLGRDGTDGTRGQEPGTQAAWVARAS